MSATNPRIGYVPNGEDLQRPGDRRRFPRYAALRGLPFEVARDDVDYDVVVLSARADITRWARAHPDQRLVYDLVDSYLAVPPGPKARLRGAAKWAARETSRPSLDYREAVRAMVRRADAVVCSTEEQRHAIAELNPNAHVVLDFHGEFGTPEPPQREAGENFHVVWEGLPATLPALRPLLPALRDVARSRPLTLHLVTDLRWPRYLDRFVVRDTQDFVDGWPVPVMLYQWHLRTMPAIAQACDVALVPMDLDDPFSRGKPENRLRVFWRLGVPVLASASPAHRRAVSRAGLDPGLLCTTLADWERGLRHHAERAADPGDIARARRVALDDYGDAVLAEAWDRVFASLS